MKWAEYLHSMRKTRRAYKMNLKENECERHGKESVKLQSGLNYQRTGCTEFVRWLHSHLVIWSWITALFARSWAYQEAWVSHVGGYQASNLFAMCPSVPAIPLYDGKWRDCPLFSQNTRTEILMSVTTARQKHRKFMDLVSFHAALGSALNVRATMMMMMSP